MVWSRVNTPKKFLRDELFVCSIFAVIMALTGLRDSHVRVLAQIIVLPSQVTSLREHPFLYEMSGAPCKFAFSAGFSSY